MPANTKTYANNLDRDISKIFCEEYAQYPSEYDKLAKIETHTIGGDYTESVLSGLGAMRAVPEGNPVTFDNPEDGNKKTITYDKFGLGFQVTEEMELYDLHNKFKSKLPKELARSANLKYDTAFFDLFNNGFATHTANDGNYLFVASGRTTLKTGDTYNNRPSTDTSLTQTSLQASYEHFHTLKDESGKPIIMDPKILLIPIQLQWTAAELLKTELKPGSMDNDYNSLQKIKGVQAFESRFLTSSSAWFVLSDQHDMRFIWRRKGKLESADDFHTGNRLYKYTVIFQKAVFDSRGIYGTTG